MSRPDSSGVPASGSAGPAAPAVGVRELEVPYEAALSSIRHSLRTPLNQIIGYCEMLQEEGEGRPPGVEAPDLEKIHAAGGQLLALINEGLSTTRVLAGKLDLASLQRDGRTLLNLIIGYTELCLEEAPAGGNPQFLEDLRRIRTAAGNLQGLLEDTTFLSPLGQTPPSVRGSGATERSTGWVSRAMPELVGSAPALVGRLLVVDDQEMNRDMLSRRLERLGHTLVLAENGRQALALLRTHTVDVILLDILMPEMDGVETLSAIKSDPALRHLPVIMLSALDELDRVVRCIEGGADDFLQKPFNPVLLKARINASLEKKRLRDQERAFLEQLQIEREKSEKLLLNILPGSIADRLKRGETTIADSFADVTVLFADLVDFTRLASTMPAAQLVRGLNEIFSQFDWLVELHHLEKIKTIGDAYMLVGGLPVPRADHAVAVAEIALDMQKVVARLNLAEGMKFDMRIGISSGPVVAGIIGSKKFIYDLWGDTVNTASRMESLGQLGQIHVSEATYQHLKGAYVLEARGALAVKGKGEMTTYFLVGRK